MYELLAAGRLGNIVLPFESLELWESRPPGQDSPLWGVRSKMKGGDKRAKLDVPTAEVRDYCLSVFGPTGFNITPMVDHMLVWRGQVYESSTGLTVQGVFGRSDLKWREAMLLAQDATHSVAVATLKHVLNENSYDDLRILLDQYPSHTVEFTALDRCFGTIPGRNAVIWECRESETGTYEDWR